MAQKLDLFGKPIKTPPKCKHCGKDKWHHRATDAACPFGKKDRTGGYSFPHAGSFTTYEPKASRKTNAP